MRIADKFGLPIVSFIDTPGAYPGIASEERHIAEAIAVNLREMFTLSVPIVAVVLGEGGSGGALGIGVADRVLILENAYYSVISPEGCAAILWKDQSHAPKAAAALKMTAPDLLKLKLVDEVIPEPAGGAHHSWETAAASVKEAILRHHRGTQETRRIRTQGKALRQIPRLRRSRRNGGLALQDSAGLRINRIYTRRLDEGKSNALLHPPIFSFNSCSNSCFVFRQNSSSHSDEIFMQRALELAREARAREEVPVGAVLVHEGTILTEGGNEVETRQDATAHAEMLAIAEAQALLKTWRLNGTTLYVTKEPCPMCAGALAHVRVDRIVFGVGDPKAGACGGAFHSSLSPASTTAAKSPPASSATNPSPSFRIFSGSGAVVLRLLNADGNRKCEGITDVGAPGDTFVTGSQSCADRRSS